MVLDPSPPPLHEVCLKESLRHTQGKSFLKSLRVCLQGSLRHTRRDSWDPQNRDQKRPKFTPKETYIHRKVDSGRERGNETGWIVNPASLGSHFQLFLSMCVSKKKTKNGRERLNERGGEWMNKVLFLPRILGIPTIRLSTECSCHRRKTAEGRDDMKERQREWSRVNSHPRILGIPTTGWRRGIGSPNSVFPKIENFLKNRSNHVQRSWDTHYQFFKRVCVSSKDEQRKRETKWKREGGNETLFIWSPHPWDTHYGVATISRLLKIIGLFWWISSVL